MGELIKIFDSILLIILFIIGIVHIIITLHENAKIEEEYENNKEITEKEENVEHYSKV